MIRRLLDLIWPRDCEVCGRPVDRPGRHVCSDCLERLPFIPVNGCCRQCGCDVHRLDGEFLCEDCRVHRPAFDRAAAALRFDDEARSMIHGFKFKNRIWLRDDFTDWIEAAVRSRFKVEKIDMIVPVPMKFFKKIDRGYNQSDILASALARRLHLPVFKNLLKRVGSPERQSSLSESERRNNVKGTFSVRHPVKAAGKTVMLVDDVMSTGSTLSECAGKLKAAGAERVWCISIARSSGG